VAGAATLADLPTGCPFEFSTDAYPAAAQARGAFEGHKAARLPCIAGDVLKWYCNSDPLLIETNPADNYVGLLRDGVLVTLAGYSPATSGAVGALSARAGTDYYYLFGSLNIPQNLPDGVYNPVLYGTAGIYLGNAVEVRSFSDWQLDTVLARFRHPVPLAGVRYDEVSGFEQQFRLPFSMVSARFPTSTEQYTDRNNRTRTTSTSLSKTYDLESDLLDEGLFEAAVLMLSHKVVILDDIPVRSAQALEANEYHVEAGVLTAKGRVEDLRFARRVNAC
jgi:hypothetical protein